MKAWVTVSPPLPYLASPTSPCTAGLAHRGQQVGQNRHRIALRPRRLDGAGLEQQVDHLPPERAVGEAQPGGGDRRVHVRVAPLGVGVGLGAGHLVRTHGVGAGQRRPQQLAHAVRHAGGGPSGRTRRRHHQAEEVHQEGALGRQRHPAAELSVAGVDGVLGRHAEREPAGLVAALRRQRLADQRDQPGGRRADVDHRRERQAHLPSLEAEREGQRVHQHRLSLAGQAVDQLEAVVPALVRGQRQGLAVGRAEHVRGAGLGRRAQRRRAAHREEPQPFGQRRQRGLGGGAAAEAGDRGRKTLQGIADEGGEHGLAPALGHLLQAAEPAGQCGSSVLRSHPGEEPEAQPDDRMGVVAERRQVPERVPRQQAVGGREGEEGRGDTGDGRIQAVQAAALYEQRDAAGQPGGGQAGHQLGERPRPARAQAHVEGAVEPCADADACARPLGLAHQELDAERRRERARFGRLGEPRGRIVGHRHRAPVERGRRRAVHHAPHEPQRLVFGQPAAHDPGLGEHRAHRIEQRLVARPQPFQRKMGALRLAGVGQPVLELPAQPLAVAHQAVAGQHGGPRPAGHDQGLGRDQRGQPARPLRQQVVEVQPEACGLAARRLPMRRRKRVRFVGGALEHDVERMAGMGEGGVEAQRRYSHEALQLFRPHHRAGATDGDRRDQRAVMADQHAAAALQRHRRLGRQEALERLPAQRPAQALQVVVGGGEREGHALGLRSS